MSHTAAARTKSLLFTSRTIYLGCDPVKEGNWPSRSEVKLPLPSAIAVHHSSIEYGVTFKIMQFFKRPFFFSVAFVVTSAVAGLIGGGALQAQDFYLRNGDCLTFYGDSITAQRFYTRDLQDFVATRYPTLQVTYHNAGVPGDKVTGGYAGDAADRVARDVKPWDPTVLTVMLGMNDGDYVPPDPKIFADYQEGYERLITMLRAAVPRARITLIENTPYDEITHGTEFPGFMATTEQNAKATPAVGQRESLPVVDAYSPVKELLEHAKAADPSFASLLVPDRIHPSGPSSTARRKQRGTEPRKWRWSTARELLCHGPHQVR